MLSLPSGEQFKTATSAIAAELFRSGVAKRPLPEVFAEVEGFIELVLQRILLPPEFVRGLVGELLILAEYLRAQRRAGESHDDPTVCWRGWARESRDFSFGQTSLEVKTTTLTVSRHRISSLDQVEARQIDGAAVELLYLVSVGLREADAGDYSVAALSGAVLELLGPNFSRASLNQAQRKFIGRLEQYGPDDRVGYRHFDMLDLAPYSQAYSTTFVPRFYKITDENIGIIRRSDLAARFPCVLPKGVAFTIELPPQIAGSIGNPTEDFRKLMELMAGGGDMEAISAT